MIESMLRRPLRAMISVKFMSYAVIYLCAIELGCATYLLISEGRLPWFGSTAPQTRNATPRTDGSQGLQLNPHFGYAGTPGVRLSSLAKREDLEPQFGREFAEALYPTITFNNHGFLSKYDYPFVDPTGRSFVIGLFGSSIAIQFAFTMEHRLNDLLSRDSRFAGRKVVLLQFANGGTKQPQNTTTLAYFLAIGQKFDLIINMDGFPEVYISWLNAHEFGADERMPYARFIVGVQNAVLESYGVLAGNDRVTAARRRQREVEEQRSRPNFAIYALWLDYEHAHLARTLEQLEKLLTTVPTSETRGYAMPLLPRTSSSDESSREAVATTWFNGSLAMAGMARMFSIPYLHMLQPNQYYTKAHFNDEQSTRLQAWKNPPVKTLVPEYYKRFLVYARDFPRFGVNFFDASGLFDDHDASVFFDACCHYTEAGNVVLADALARQILAMDLAPSSPTTQTGSVTEALHQPDPVNRPEAMQPEIK
jgi:hypothetical protein